jgi:predicted aldo/keto reductase-like oxidoreductase
MTRKSDLPGSISRRHFLATGGAAAAVGSLPLSAKAEEVADKPKVTRHRTLGRTGFEVSDVSLGCGFNTEPNVYRYAYDHGMNYFDNAESYANGESERALGEALQHMDRKKVFITSKTVLMGGETEQVIIDRFDKAQERLRTDYVDAFMMHGVAKRDILDNQAFHAAVTKLKADGRLRYVGVSCHGPRQQGEDSMEDVLIPAAEDGRFDIFLMSYNFMIKDEAEKILAVCKKNNVATTAMKTAPGTREMPPWDPENPTGEAAEQIAQMVEHGMTREQAIAMIDAYVTENQATLDSAKPWMEKQGVTDMKDYHPLAVKWVLSNPDMHTVCVTIQGFDTIDRFVPLSGSKLARGEQAVLDRYRMARSSSYCRHGCIQCAGSCPEEIQVSTIMRYSNYFAGQGREKHAMVKYARLGGRDGSVCMSCTAPCTGACPHGFNIQANLVRAHNLLTIA